jgi:DhnA family fructose-bisphosphate aldolase class Ia
MGLDQIRQEPPDLILQVEPRVAVGLVAVAVTVYEGSRGQFLI